MTKFKALAYIKMTANGPTHLEEQEKAMHQYASEQDIEIVRVYKDVGLMKNVFETSTLRELLLNLEGNNQGITALLVEQMDQLAHDLAVQAAFVYQLRFQGVKVISAQEGLVWAI